MWLNIALFAGCALCCALCIWCLLRTTRAMEACNHAEARLLQQRGRIVGLEGAIENVDAKFRKLAGRVYADERWERERADARPDNYPPTMAAHVALQGREAEYARLAQGARGCENWLRAQKEGPLSDAARCECPLCVAARLNRDAFRASAVKLPTAQVKLAGGSDG